jgi:hypothetical protein
MQQAPTDERLAEFVADLVDLRRRAGQPSLRAMAATAHYSHTALSSVLSGVRLPSLELTLAFVRACGGDEAEWRSRWQRASPVAPSTEATPEPAANPPSRVSRWVFAATAGVAALATAVVIAVISGGGPPNIAAVAPSPAAVADGSDPQEQRCQLDAVNARSVQIPDPDPNQPPYGALTLRYSPRCQAAWPLFVSTERVPTGATIRLITARPADGAATRFDYPYMIPSQVYSVFGNVLQTTRGCVAVTVEITTPDHHGQLATADTPCVTLS